MSEEGKKKSLGMPLEMARQKALQDPDVQKAAEILGVDLEEYVEKILYFAQNPDAEPELHVLDEESRLAMEAEGEIPREAEVVEFFASAARGELPSQNRGFAKKDGFSSDGDDAARIRRSLGQDAPMRAPMVGSSPKPTAPPPGKISG